MESVVEMEKDTLGVVDKVELSETDTVLVTVLLTEGLPLKVGVGDKDRVVVALIDAVSHPDNDTEEEGEPVGTLLLLTLKDTVAEEDT